MDDIPSDILLNIFEECLPAPDELYPSVYSTLQPPLLFTLVNTRWRDLAYASATLWTRFHVDLEAHWNPIVYGRPGKPFRNRDSVTGKKIKQWLGRCAGANISLSLRIARRYGNPRGKVREQEDWIMTIVDIICGYSNQWERVIVFRVDEPYQSRLFSIPPEKLPRLSHIAFPAYTGSDGAWHADKGSAVAFEDCGMLRGPRLSAIALQRLPPLEAVSRNTWKMVQELELLCSNSLPESIPSKKAELVLRQCSNLTRLSLRISVDVSFQLESRFPIVLPRLRYFNLFETQAPFSITPLLSILQLPSLSELVFQVKHMFNSTLYQTSLRALFQANEFTICRSLTHLCFEYANFSPGGMRYLFSLVPQITHLTLLARMIEFNSETYQGYKGLKDFHHLIPEMVDVGNDTDSGTTACRVTCLLPNLQLFHCRLCFDGELTEGELIEFIEKRLMYASRSNSAIPGGVLSRLESVYVGFVSPKVVDVEQVLLERGVDMKGFRLEVEYGLETLYRMPHQFMSALALKRVVNLNLNPIGIAPPCLLLLAMF